LGTRGKKKTDMTDERVPEKAPEINHVPKFLFFMFFYLCLVYACTLNIYPMGRDYSLMSASEGAYSNGIVPWTFWETHIWKDWTPGYHLVNLTLLYGCMVAIFFLTRHIVRGPWWMGSLAATLFMANPVKSEAVLNLSGIQDLLPVFLILVSLANYASHVRNPKVIQYLFSVVFYALGVVCLPVRTTIVLAYFLIEIIIADRKERNLWRLVPFFIVTVLFGGIENEELRSILRGDALDPLGMFLPLVLIPYPIGFLPETIDRLQGHYGLVVLYGFIIIAAILGLGYAARHRGFVFGILAAVCLRFFRGDNPFDVVHMIGGGQLLLPVAFMSIAFAALVHRVIQHPKWLRPMVFLTALLCVVFFGLQFQMNMIWRYAGQQVQAFQQECQKMSAQNPDTCFAILPNYLYYRGAPMMFHAAVFDKTPFTPTGDLPLKHTGLPLMTLSRHGKERYEFTIDEQSEGKPEITLIPEGSYLPKKRASGYCAGWSLFSPEQWNVEDQSSPYLAPVAEGHDGSQRFSCSVKLPIMHFALARPWIDW